MTMIERWNNNNNNSESKMSSGIENDSFCSKSSSAFLSTQQIQPLLRGRQRTTRRRRQRQRPRGGLQNRGGAAHDDCNRRIIIGLLLMIYIVGLLFSKHCCYAFVFPLSSPPPAALSSTTTTRTARTTIMTSHSRTRSRTPAVSASRRRRRIQQQRRRRLRVGDDTSRDEEELSVSSPLSAVFGAEEDDQDYGDRGESFEEDAVDDDDDEIVLNGDTSSAAKKAMTTTTTTTTTTAGRGSTNGNTTTEDGATSSSSTSSSTTPFVESLLTNADELLQLVGSRQQQGGKEEEGLEVQTVKEQLEQQQQPVAPGSSSSSTTTTTTASTSTTTVMAASPTEGANNNPVTSRRMVFASSLLALGAAVGGKSIMSSSSGSTTMNNGSNDRFLSWEVTPVNKRTGVTVFDAEKAGYNIKFITYLSRFLLCFDEACQRWWYSRASDIPRTATLQQVNELRLKQFGAFSASVEVGLQEYQGQSGSGKGPILLLESLLKRYCPDIDDIQKLREQKGLQRLNDAALAREEREIKEARRQIALLFGLMEKNQPTERLTQLLAAIDDGSISEVDIVDGGGGYAPGYGPPRVIFPEPQAGEGYTAATGRATLSPNGRILRVDVVNRGNGYYITKPPTVIIAPPAALRFASTTTSSSTTKNDDDLTEEEHDESSSSPPPMQAEAKAYLFRSGPNKGRIERIELTNPGSGYRKEEIIRVKFSSPDLSSQQGGIVATATAVLEYEVSSIQIITNGTGYAVEKPLLVYVDPPPLTARINLMDPYMAQMISKKEYLPATAISTSSKDSIQKSAKRIPSDMLNDPTSFFSRASYAASFAGSSSSNNNNNNGASSSSSCIGRGCYDRPVVAIAYPRGDNDIFSAYRTDDDSIRASKIESALDVRSATTALQQQQQQEDKHKQQWQKHTPKRAMASMRSKPTNIDQQQQEQQQQQQQQQRIVKGTSSGVDGGPTPLLSFGGRPSSSSQLLSLLPAGIGLEYNKEDGIYRLALDPTLESGLLNNNVQMPGWMTQDTTTMRFDPDFGPRGRSPIEREMEIGISSYIRFVASGAICCSGVHLALTPIDVVKTKVQTNPKRYPGIIRTFQRVLNEEGGSATFFTGWIPTFLGFFIWGGVSYALTEYLRRTATILAGTQANDLDVPIILFASGVAAIVGSFVLCPFEAVRIRSVAQPNYASGIYGVLQRLVKEEGISTLFAAVPAFLAKEIPFAMSKFTIFDLSTQFMYDIFPAAREDIQLSLLVSLTGGTLGGIAAAIVSNPADVTVSELKKASSKLTAIQAYQNLLEQNNNNYAVLFRGLPLRMIFYSLVVSLQFLVYDSVRFALGIGADDLKLYLDVLGGALKESGGPV